MNSHVKVNSKAWGGIQESCKSQRTLLMVSWSPYTIRVTGFLGHPFLIISPVSWKDVYSFGMPSTIPARVCCRIHCTTQHPLGGGSDWNRLSRDASALGWLSSSCVWGLASQTLEIYLCLSDVEEFISNPPNVKQQTTRRSTPPRTAAW